jgi:hypothetical protein
MQNKENSMKDIETEIVRAANQYAGKQTELAAAVKEARASENPDAVLAASRREFLEHFNAFEEGAHWAAAQSSPPKVFPNLQTVKNPPGFEAGARWASDLLRTLEPVVFPNAQTRGTA